MPLLLPWLAVLVLLALPFNRVGKAWWVLLPLALFAGLRFGLGNLGAVIPQVDEVVEMFGQLTMAAAVGLAAVCLLGGLLHKQPWPVVFVGLLLIQAAFSVVALASEVAGDLDIEALGQFVFLCFCGLGLILALTLAGLMGRRRYDAAGFAIRVLLVLLVGWLLISAPFSLIAGFTAGAVALSMLFGAAMIALASFAVLLPFLLLAFTNGFYKERLKALLGVPSEPAPPPPFPAR